MGTLQKKKVIIQATTTFVTPLMMKPSVMYLIAVKSSHPKFFLHLFHLMKLDLIGRTENIFLRIAYELMKNYVHSVLFLVLRFFFLRKFFFRVHLLLATNSFLICLKSFRIYRNLFMRNLHTQCSQRL